MTITDVVFPAFLFITGMAIPLALARGSARRFPRRVWRHVSADGDVLLFLGVLMINAEHAGASGRRPAALEPLMTRAVVSCSRARRGGPWPGRGGCAGLSRSRADPRVSRGRRVRMDPDPAVLVGHPRPHRLGLPGGGAALPARRRPPAILVGGRAPLPGRPGDEATDRASARDPPVVSVARDAGRARRARPLRRRPRPCSRRHREAAPPRASSSRALGFALASRGGGAAAARPARRASRSFEISKIRATAAWCLLSAAWHRGRLDGALRLRGRGRASPLAARDRDGGRERACHLSAGAVPAVRVRADRGGARPRIRTRALGGSLAAGLVAFGRLRVGRSCAVRLDARARPALQL
jgi:hypothetical protein